MPPSLPGRDSPYGDRGKGNGSSDENLWRMESGQWYNIMAMGSIHKHEFKKQFIGYSGHLVVVPIGFAGLPEEFS